MRTRERTQLGWATTQTSLARALAEIGTRTHDPARCQKALELAGAALEVFEAAGAPHYMAKAREQRDAIRAKLTNSAPP